MRASRRSSVLFQARLQGGEHADHPQARTPVRARRAAFTDAVDEVLALDPERLAVRDAWAANVARAGDVLAVGARVLIEALVIDGDLALKLHVVEGRHPAGADDGEAARLVRIEPRQVQVRGDA